MSRFDSKTAYDTGRRRMVGDDDLDVDQQQAEGQHNHQWMDTLIGHTSFAAGSGGNGKHPSLGALVSARPAEWPVGARQPAGQRSRRGQPAAAWTRQVHGHSVFHLSHFQEH